MRGFNGNNDAMNLAMHFIICWYMEGDGFFNVAFDNKREDAINTTIESQSANWGQTDVVFEKQLENHKDFIISFGKAIMICDGNHYL